MPISIISTPDGGYSVRGGDKSQGFEYYETKGHRNSQEDALAWHVLPADAVLDLSPEDIGYRLWTAYRLLDKSMLEQASKYQAGTTASTTVYDGRGNLITATLADAVAFAAIYDSQNKIRHVIRLNQVTHSPQNPDECKRLKNIEGSSYHASAGKIYAGDSYLRVSRAIGDATFKHMACSDASIDITTTAELAALAGIEETDIGCIKIITTCDGFTEPVDTEDRKKERTPEEMKVEHEKYLLAKLRDYQKETRSVTLPEFLAEAAITDQSADNISVSIQTLPGPKEEPLALLQGVYDGHGGAQVSTFVAKNMGACFLAQCRLTPEQYAAQALSVMKFPDIYQRDNPKSSPLDHASQPSSSSAIAASSSSSQSTAEPEPYDMATLITQARVDLEVNTLAKQIQTAINAAHTRYTGYHRLSRDLKNQDNRVNRGQGDGMLSFFRHLSSGLRMANTWNAEFSNIQDDDLACNHLLRMLHHPKTSFHRHSFGSYVLDEMDTMLRPKGVRILPGGDGIYRNVPVLIQAIETTLKRSSHSFSV